MTEFPSLRATLPVWGRIAALSFGGPAGQIAVMHRILVEEKRWISEERFLHALNFCMVLPGPEAQQLATYIGWLMHGVRGALVAGLLFILPGVLAIMGLSWVYAIWGGTGLVAGALFGIKAAVLAIVLQAVLRVGKRALKTPAMRAIAVGSFVAIFAFGAPFPLLVVIAALIGFAGAGRAGFVVAAGHGAQSAAPVREADTLLGARSNGTRSGALRAGGVALLLWLAPVALLYICAPESVFSDIATFFAKLALLTFGGAYAVLAWVAQAAVGDYGWLAPQEMLDGLGMAETTPGPLIMVLQFVGFIGAMREAGWANPLLAGTAGGLLASWVTFAPCFAWIFLGAPFMERLRANQTLAAALSAVTAAVVGVILNLGIWFGLHVLWRKVERLSFGPLQMDLPVLSTLDGAAAVLCVLALLAVFWLRLGMAKVIAGCAILGLVLHSL